MLSNMDGGSHIPVLVKIMEKNTKPVLEFGAGWYSTPLLFWLCREKEIPFESYETDGKWVEQLDGMSKWVDDYRDAPVDEKEWGVVFLDHAPAERRKEDVMRFKDKADYIIIHDSEPENDRLYQYSKIYQHFEYRYTYKKHKPYTTVLSNKYEFTL